MKGMITAAVGLLISFNAAAGLVVIGSPSLPDGLTASDAKKAYLGKKTGYNGGNLTVLELADSNAEKAEFHQAVTKKSLAQLESYWSKKLFTGKGTPPPASDTPAQLKAKIASSSNAIGYIDESQVDGSVKVLLKL
ncbi:hypothetical protein EJ063_11725 [Vibrio aquaticus]|uniref:Phosphate ABC transporter substrate-binding protein n=1 Tax=Vibrio aquaticus TaxID=2496559 RepID=A0A3S0N5A3_9VIBR|nr:hypothetical protein [Vibrio aquaticus]RTZ15736.1 hypothetical protein EJ063_11725 [Vibrio aquaticus]